MPRPFTIHFCFLDKHCRKYDCPPRVNIGWGPVVGGGVRKHFVYLNLLNWRDRGAMHRG